MSFDTGSAFQYFTVFCLFRLMGVSSWGSRDALGKLQVPAWKIASLANDVVFIVLFQFLDSPA